MSKQALFKYNIKKKVKCLAHVAEYTPHQLNAVLEPMFFLSLSGRGGSGKLDSVGDPSLPKGCSVSSTPAGECPATGPI